ncbi:MAG: hypothetical protein HYY41_02860 [Chloroflexi bacterium]|nr:hypothetical protein [Chloroflexota bacterium]
MPIKMKVLSYDRLAALNKSSVNDGRKQNLQPERMPGDRNRKYIVNFHFDHDWAGGRDTRMSVILQPGVLTAWLDVSNEEYDAIPEVELSELDWEAAICVGTPPWTG